MISMSSRLKCSHSDDLKRCILALRLSCVADVAANDSMKHATRRNRTKKGVSIARQNLNQTPQGYELRFTKLSSVHKNAIFNQCLRNGDDDAR